MPNLEEQIAEVIAQMRQEIDTWMIKLAACSSAALQNTETTVKDRLTKDNPYWSAAYGDVCAAVDREMKLRQDLEECRDKLFIAYDKVQRLSEVVEITMKDLEECKDAIEIKDRYIDGHKGEMTSLNRENIQLKADLVKLRQELEEYQKFKFRRMLAYGLPEDCTLSQLEVHEDHVQRERARLLYDGIILEADLARTQRALELACRQRHNELKNQYPSCMTTEQFMEGFLAQADKKETP